MRLLIVLFTLCSTPSSFAQQHILSPQAMQADCRILYDAWTTLHPGLYRYNTPEQMETTFKMLSLRCATPLPETRFYILLSQLAEQVKCGHTYLNPLNLDSATASRVLPQKVIPFFFEIVEQSKMIITEVVQQGAAFQRGDEIIAVNGIPVRRIMDSLLTVSRSDGNHAIGKKYFNINETADEADSYSLFDIYFPLFFPEAGNRTVTVKRFNAPVIHTYSIIPLGLRERADAYRKIFGHLPTGEHSWSYRRLDSVTAYMKFGTFAFWNSIFNAKRCVDSFFAAAAKDRQIKNLIIDIRNNEGGDNTGNYILSYITRQKIGCDDPDHRCFRFLTVPPSLLPYLSTWDKSFKAPKDPSCFFLNNLHLYEQVKDGEDCGYILPQQKSFEGKVYLLINAKNSSAGYEMARNCKVNHLATLIGETTGGSQQGINGGQFFFLTLPHSKFEIDLPLIYNYHPSKPDSGISPDYPLFTSQEDIAYRKDAQLQFCLNLIRQIQP